MKQVGEHVNGKKTFALPHAPANEPPADPVAQVAAQLRTMTEVDRARLAVLLDTTADKTS